MSPKFHEHDVVSITRDLRDIDSERTANPEFVDLSRGALGTVHGVYWNENINEHEYLVEFTDATGMGLIALPILPESILEMHQKAEGKE